MKRCAGGIEYELTRKAVKNLNLRLRPDGSVTVSIPKRVTLAEADRFVEQNADRIRQARQRLDCRPEYLQIPAEYQDGDRFWLFGVPYRLRLGATGEITLRGGELFLPFPAPLSSRDPRLTRWLNRQLEPVLREMIAGLVPRLAAFCPHRPGELRLRLMTSRWGAAIPAPGNCISAPGWRICRLKPLGVWQPMNWPIWQCPTTPPPSMRRQNAFSPTIPAGRRCSVRRFTPHQRSPHEAF